jgi:hypothetical protein
MNPNLEPHLRWIESRLGQLGIDVRQSKQHQQMRFYLKLLRDEIQYTEDFLKEDGEAKGPDKQSTSSPTAPTRQSLS